MKILAATFLIGLSAGSAAGQATGNELLSKCKGVVVESRDFVNNGMCLGFVNSAMQSTRFLNFMAEKSATKPLFCVPEGVTVGQAVRVVVKDLESHPELLHEIAYFQVLRSFEGAWPCPAVPK